MAPVELTSRGPNPEATAARPEYVWLNDDLLPLTEARISILDRGFLYGDGFFETLRVEAGRPLFLAEHLERLQKSAQNFRITWPDHVSWGRRLTHLVAANGLEKGLAAVKILLSRGVQAHLGLPEPTKATLVIWARPYTPPNPAEYLAGWPAVVFPERRSTFLGRHKSLNYLFYLAARQYALDQGAREALILESDGLVSEGAATSLLYKQGKEFYTPEAPSALPGVTLKVLSQALTRRGHTLIFQPTPLSRLYEAEAVWLANSLMGLMPVSALNGTPIRLSPQDTAFLQDCLAAESKKGGKKLPATHSPRI